MAINKKSWLYIAAAAIGALWLYTSTKDLINKISFSFLGISTGGSLFSPKVTITLSADNPSVGSANVQNINCNVLYMGNSIGIVNLPRGFVVKANSSTPFNLDLNINDIGTLLTIYKIVTTKQAGNSMQILGDALVDGVTVPIDLNYTF